MQQEFYKEATAEERVNGIVREYLGARIESVGIDYRIKYGTTLVKKDKPDINN